MQSILEQIQLMKNQSESTTVTQEISPLLHHAGIIPVKKTSSALQPETKLPSTNSVHHFEPSFLKPAKVVINQMFASVEKYAGLNTIGGMSRSLVFFSWKDYA